MIKQNIGILNALIRITCGLTFVTISGVRMARRRKNNGSGSIFLLIMAAMKVGEGIVRYCPVTDAATRMIDNAAESNYQDNSNQTKQPVTPTTTNTDIDESNFL